MRGHKRKRKATTSTEHQAESGLTESVRTETRPQETPQGRLSPREENACISNTEEAEHESTTRFRFDCLWRHEQWVSRVRESTRRETLRRRPEAGAHASHSVTSSGTSNEPREGVESHAYLKTIIEVISAISDVEPIDPNARDVTQRDLVTWIVRAMTKHRRDGIRGEDSWSANMASTF